jgi:hypothetical protein
LCCCCVCCRARASERASEKRKAAEQGGPDAKVPRSATPAGAESSAGNTPARTPTPTPLQAQQQQQGGDVLSMLLPGGIARSADPTSDVQRVLEVLVEHQQQQAVEVRRVEEVMQFAACMSASISGYDCKGLLQQHQQQCAVCAVCAFYAAAVLVCTLRGCC